MAPRSALPSSRTLRTTALVAALVVPLLLVASPASGMPWYCGLLCPPDVPPVYIAGTHPNELQQDGGWSGDASNNCAYPSPILTTPVNTHGMMGGATGDRRDNYDLRIASTPFQNVRVEVDAQLPLGLRTAIYHDIDLYVRAAPSASCGAVLASNTGTSATKSATFARGAATRFVIELVDNGLKVRGFTAALCGPSVCLDDERLLELDTMCYPACSTVDSYAGYLLKAQPAI